MNDTMSPERLLEIISRRNAEIPNRDIVAYWYQVLTDRNQYAKELAQLTAGRTVVPMVVRVGFSNYNSVMNDLRQLVIENREKFEPPGFPELPVEHRVTLVLLSKTAFELPETDSPVPMPEWFPVRGGEIVKIKIEDLCWKALVPLDAEDVRCDELCERIFELETALVRRWRLARRRNAAAGDHFFARIRSPSSPRTADEFLTQAESYHTTLTVRSGFRPSAKQDTHSLVGQIFRLAGQTSRDDLLPRARELADALSLPLNRQAPTDSLVTVLNRSTNVVSEQPSRLARNLILTVYAASQLVNAKAHKDSAPEFALVLLQGLSLNLRETLFEIASCLDDWPLLI